MSYYCFSCKKDVAVVTRIYLNGGEPDVKPPFVPDPHDPDRWRHTDKAVRRKLWPDENVCADCGGEVTPTLVQFVQEPLTGICVKCDKDMGIADGKTVGVLDVCSSCKAVDKEGG
jgi:hypothetical protein